MARRHGHDRQDASRGMTCPGHDRQDTP